MSKVKIVISKIVNKGAEIVLIVLALSVAFAFQGSRGLYESTEGRYAESSREMLETGNWLVPQLDNHPHFTKPPLSYWSIMVGMKLFGRNEWGIRFSNALVFFLIVFFVCSFGTLLWDKHTGYIAGILYATLPLPVIACNVVSPDVVLSLWVLLAVLSYWKTVRNQGTDFEKRWMVGMWVFFGLGFLTKGPPALLSLLVIIVFHFYRKRSFQKVPRLVVPLGTALFILLGISWYVYVSLKYSGVFKYWIFDEVVNRIFTSKFKRNSQWYQPVFIYFVPLLLGLGPWLIFWPGIIKKYKLVANLSRAKQLLCKNDAVFFLFLWLVIPLLILSVARSRLVLYILPSYPALILTTARGLAVTYKDTKWMKVVPVIAIIMGTVLITAKRLSVDFPSNKNMKHLYEFCKAEDEGETEFALFDEQKMAGLKFYMKGSLDRISMTPKQPWADSDLGTLSEEIKGNPRYKKYVLVARTKKSMLLQRALQSAGLPYSVNTNAKGYRLFVIRSK